MTNSTVGDTFGRMSESVRLPLIARAQDYDQRTAVMDGAGAHAYRELLVTSAQVATALLDGSRDLEGERVAFLIAPSFSWVGVQWGIWRAGGIAVPLPLGSPDAELEYFLTDTKASVLICDSANREVAERAAAACQIRVLVRRTAPCGAIDVAERAQRAAGDDPLHERHDKPSEGRCYHASEHRGAGRLPHSSMGVVA